MVDGKDYVTLMTCTPYGINSHRLLVRGRRIETPDKLKHIRVTSEATKIEPIITAPIIALPLLLALLRLLVLPIPFCLLFLMYERGAELVWWAFPLAECITAVVSVPLLLRTFRKKTMPSA